MSEEAQYQTKLAIYQRRRFWARLVRIVATIIAVCLLIVGGALLASALQGAQPGSRAANQYIPGVDGAITLLKDGQHAITRPSGDLPTCEVTTSSGEVLAQTPYEESGSTPLPASLFTASAGPHKVFCEGGNEGVVVYTKDELFIVQHGYLYLMLQALPFIVGAVVCYAIGWVVARRLVPEHLIPNVPS